MDRRSALAAVAALFTVGSSGTGSGETATRPTTTASTPPTAIDPREQDRPGTARAGSRREDGRSRIRAARDRLKTAPAAFETAFDRVNYLSRSARFDGEPVETVLDDARTRLRAAADVATDEQKRTIDALEGYIELFERLLAVTDPLVNDRPPLTGFDPAAGHEEAADDLERERSWLGEVRQALELAQVGFRTTRMEVDDPASVALGDAREVLARLEAFAAGLETGFDGDRELLEGWKDYGRGRKDYADGRTRLAILSFKKAEAHFYRAEDRYIEAGSVGPAKLERLFRSRRCRGRDYRNAAGQMQQAAVLRDNVPDEARKYSSEARRALSGGCTT